MNKWTYTDERYAPAGAPVGLPDPQTLCITTEWPDWITEDGVDHPSCTINTWDGENWQDNENMVFAWQPLKFPKPARVPKSAWPTADNPARGSE